MRAGSPCSGVPRATSPASFSASRVRVAGAGLIGGKAAPGPLLLLLQRFLVALDALDDALHRVLGAVPAVDLDPLALLQILVVLEEVRDLVADQGGQGAHRLHVLVQR